MSCSIESDVPVEGNVSSRNMSKDAFACSIDKIEPPDFVRKVGGGVYCRVLPPYNPQPRGMLLQHYPTSLPLYQLIMATSEASDPTYTVFIRLPFPREDFVDPPSVCLSLVHAPHVLTLSG
jgi:hypothetical protein